MRVEIVDVTNESAHYHNRHRFIGMTGTIATKDCEIAGFTSGIFYPDNNKRPNFFYGIKTKPIYDDSGQ